MGRVQAAAQAQAQQQTNISHTESLELVRCLLRVSIFHVSYLRGLFPEKSFKGVDMKNLEDMHIKMLLPACDESRRLVDWVEGGVYDSIKRGYLKNLFFGISTDAEGTQLLEEYIFTFKYGENGQVAMDINAVTGAEGGDRKRGTRNKGEFKQDGSKADLSTVRYQVCRLIRMLVQVCHTLDKVPAERYLFMKLTYQDHTPDEYEPPYFVPVDESGVGHFKRAPFSMNVGRVSTDHHSVSLKVKSTLDSCDDEMMDGEAGDTGQADGARGGEDRVTAQAQPSAGSVGSDDVGTRADTEGAGTEGGVAGGQTELLSADVTGRGGDAEGGMEGVEDGGEGQQGTPGVEATAAPMPMPTPGKSALTGNTDLLQANTDPLASSPAGATDPGRNEVPSLDLQPPQLQLQPVAAPDEPAAAMEVDGGGAGTAAGGTANDNGDGGDEDDVTEVPEAEDYLAVREYVRGRNQITLRQLSRKFGDMPQAALEGYVGRLAEQGVLAAVPNSRSSYRVVPAEQQRKKEGDAAAAAAAPTGAGRDKAAAAGAAGGKGAAPGKRRQDGGEGEDAAALIAKRLDGLTMEPGRAGGAVNEEVEMDEGAGAAGNDVRRRSRDQHADRDVITRSRGGRLESAQAGDERTESPEAGDVRDGKRPGGGGGDAPAEPAEEEPKVYIVDSQHSGPDRTRGGRVRKASYVADPIQQGGAAAKKPKTAAGHGGKAGNNGTAAAAAPAGPAAGPSAAAGTAGTAAAGTGSTPRATRAGSRLASMRRGAA